jgi:hypothetical protein
MSVIATVATKVVKRADKIPPREKEILRLIPILRCWGRSHPQKD